MGMWGVGQSLPISDCQLPIERTGFLAIGLWPRGALFQLAIGNWKSAVTAHCMCLLEADNADHVREVNETAKIPFTRIVEALDLTP
ncbi:MAG: DUF4242 domain-containing protein, partial [Pyrinomonadaceae bacterium]|nr:DUF4242 domain-containing protein [Pyrinomonadaceae bacterium]